MRFARSVVFLILILVVTACVEMPVVPDRPYPVGHGYSPSVRIDNLEATPRVFSIGQSIDFRVRLTNLSGYDSGFDVGVYHEGRLVGWVNDVTLSEGQNSFRLYDSGFTGDLGKFIVRVRYRGSHIAEKKFYTFNLGSGRFTLDQKTPLPPPPPPWNEKHVSVTNLEAMPVQFSAGQLIDFIVKIENRGATYGKFDIGVFHGGRLVGWAKGKTLFAGTNTFKLRDDGFSGDPGAYLVKITHNGRTIAEKRFITHRTADGRFTLDPKSKPPWDNKWVTILNLEASPKWFGRGQPIDFVAKIDNKGLLAQGFDIGVFHEGRQIAWEMNKSLATGTNTFRVRDVGFSGDPGYYIIKVRKEGVVISEKRFRTYKLADGRYTLDPAAPPPPPPGPVFDESTVSIKDLDTKPKRFSAGQPVEFTAKVMNSGPLRHGFEVSVFQGSRQVGWIKNVALNPGTNMFRLQDNNFTGQAGAYVLKIHYQNRVIKQKIFVARKLADGKYMIENSL